MLRACRCTAAPGPAPVKRRRDTLVLLTDEVAESHVAAAVAALPAVAGAGGPVIRLRVEPLA